MTAASPPEHAPAPPPATPPRPARSRLWAPAALLIVALVWGGAYLAHRVVAARTLAAAQVPAPRDPLATLARVMRPEAGAPFIAPLGDTGQFVLLAGPHEQDCPPTGACSPAPALDNLLVVDAVSGTTLAQVALTGAASQPVALAVDAARGLADVISPGTVDVYATATGAHLGTFALPFGVSADSTTHALVMADGTLLLTGTLQGLSDEPVLVAVDARTGAHQYTLEPASGLLVFVIAQTLPSTDALSTAAPPPTTTLGGPVYDPTTGFLALTASSTNGGTNTTTTTTLKVFDPASGATRGTWTLPPGSQLGPLDPASQTLYVFEPGGATASATESALSVALQPTPPTPSSPDGTAQPAPLTAQPALAGARALGWNDALGHTYIEESSGLRILDANNHTIEALPLLAHQSADQPLATDTTDGLLAVATDHGALAIVRDAIFRGAANTVSVTPDTAALLARAAVATLPPQNGQQPPFLTPATFTVGPGTRDLNFYAYDADFGTTGPYPGTATLAVAAVGAPGGRPSGAYNVTFTITWNLRFIHTRTWTYQVAPTGAVRLLSQSGDGLPCCQTPGQTSG